MVTIIITIMNDQQKKEKIKNNYITALSNIKDLEESVRTCNPNTPTKTFLSTIFIESALSLKEIDEREWEKQMDKISELNDKFEKNCSCSKK